MWSKDRDNCIECGTTERNHQSRGRCTTCHSRFWYHKSPKRREQQKRATARWRKKNPGAAKKISKRATEKYQEVHKEELNEKARKFYRENIEMMRERNRKRYHNKKKDESR